MKNSTSFTLIIITIISLFIVSDSTFADDISADDWVSNSGNTYVTSGNVGIGTSTPLSKFQILNTNPYTTGEDDYFTDSIGLYGSIANQNGNYFGGITWHNGSRRRAGIASVMEHDDSDYVGIAFFTKGRDGTGPFAESMRISHSGNVGIGTTTPQSKLVVNGTITSKEVKVTETGWSDFVFEEAYTLPSLKKVESYIKENKHLPDIPSAKRVEEEGLSMAEMMKKQMQKIEELTLYVIEQNKQIDALKAEVTELKKE